MARTIAERAFPFPVSPTYEKREKNILVSFLKMEVEGTCSAMDFELGLSNLIKKIQPLPLLLLTLSLLGKLSHLQVDDSHNPLICPCTKAPACCRAHSSKTSVVTLRDSSLVLSTPLHTHPSENKVF
jgi:hypothetical protein